MTSPSTVVLGIVFCLRITNGYFDATGVITKQVGTEYAGNEEIAAIGKLFCLDIRIVWITGLMYLPLSDPQGIATVSVAASVEGCFQSLLDQHHRHETAEKANRDVIGPPCFITYIEDNNPIFDKRLGHHTCLLPPPAR